MGRPSKIGVIGPRGSRGARGATGAIGRRGDTGKPGPKGLRGVQGLRGPLHNGDLSKMVVEHFEAVYQQLSIQAKWIERLQASAPGDEHAPSKADLPATLGDNRLATRLARMHHLIDELEREAGEDERLKEACDRLCRELDAARRTLRHELTISRRGLGDVGKA
jgi:collagen triple helix repeat protein